MNNKKTTSKDSIKSMVISATTVGLTQGVTNLLNSSLSTITNTSNNIINSITESVASNLASSTIQSIMNKEDFFDTLKDQGINTIIGAVSNLGAKQIGSNYHNGNITKTEQLLLHATLGGSISAISGNDVLSGAISGVMGEVMGSYLESNGVSKRVGVEISGLAGGLSAVLTGSLLGLKEGDIVDNIYSGQRLGKNASENNAYSADRPLEGYDKIYKRNYILDYLNQEPLHEQFFFEDEIGGNIGFFGDNTVRADDNESLSKYKKKR